MEPDDTDQDMRKSDIEARVVSVIGRIEALVRQGRYRDARAIAERDLGEAEQLGRLHPGYAASRHALGVVAYHLGEYREATDHLREALELREQLEGAGAVSVGETLRELGAAYRASSEFATAESCYDRARGIFQAAFPDGNRRTADTLNNLAILYYYQSRLAESEQMARSALTLRRTHLDASDPLVAQSLTNLGEILLAQGRLDEAERCVEEGLRIRQSVLEPQHPDIAASLNNLAVVHYDKGDFVAAEAVQRQVVEIDTAVYGPGALEVALDLQNLAEIWAKQRRLAPTAGQCNGT